MRTFILSICAVFCAACAFAQTSFISSVDFNVAGQVQATDENGLPLDDSYTVPSTDATVHITFNGYDADYATTHGIMPMLMYTTGTGFAISEPQYEVLDPSDSNFSFSLAGKWGDPSMGNYYATLMICFVDDEMEFVFNADGDPLFWQVAYSTPNTDPATFKYAYPDGDWSEESFTEAYNNGVITFAFTNPVEFANESNVATIVYTLDGEDFEENISQSACEIGWNRLDGYYAVAFQFSSEDYPVEDLSKVTITLDGVEYTKESGEKVSVSVPTITLKNNTATPAPHQKKSRLASDLSTGTSLLNVYNIQGMLVKEGISKSEVNNLPAGLYIIEGKKIIVH